METAISSTRTILPAEEPPVSGEVQTLRRVVRDLVALSAMPSVWVDSDLRRSIQNLTDVVRAALRAFAVYVRIEFPDGFRFETASATGLTHASRPTHELSELLDAPPPHSTTLLRIPKFNGSGPVNALPRPIYSSEKQIGILLACYPANFRPDENAQLILQVTANQLNLLLERHRDQEERFARALAEERLRKTEHHYQQLVQALPTAVYTCDAEGRITMFNEAAAQLWGRRPAIGKDTWCGSVRIYNTDLTDLPIEDCPMAVAIREGRSVRGKEIIIERPDGTRSHVLPHPDPIRDEKGAVVGAVNMLVDIGPLKRAEQEVRSSENRLQSLLKLMPAAVYACDADGRITFFNPRAAELWGREPRLNDDHQKFCAAYRCWFGGETLTPEQTPMAVAVREGKSFRNLEPVFERSDGKRVSVLVNIDALFDGAGKPAGAINVFQDVTALKRAEEALREREEWHRATFHQAAVGIASASLDGRLVEVNNKFCEVFGYTSDEMRKLKISDLTHPEDRPRTAEKMRLLLSGETPSYAYEKRFLRKDGKVVWAYVTVTTIKDAVGKPTRFVGVIEDITQRKQVEAELGRRTKELTAFFETAAIALHWVGPEGRILWANAAEMEMLGYSPEEYIGRHISEIHADQDVLEQVLNRLSRGEKICDQEARLKCKDGSIRHVLIDSSVLWEDGRFIHTQCFTRDITDRKRAEERLRKRGERLQLLSETLGQLLSARDPNLIVRELFPKVAEHLGVDTYFNFMVTGREDVLVLHSCAGIPEETAKQLRELPLGQAICGTVAQTRAPIHGMDIQNSAYEKANLVRGFGLQCFACNPLIAGDRLLGTLSFASRTRKAFDEDELQFLQLISQYTAVALDRLQSGEQLRESEERFRSVINNSTTVIYVKDIEGRYLLINRSYERLFQVVERDLLGKTDSDLFPADIAEKFRRNDLEVIRTGKPLEIEEVAPHGDGPHTYISIKFPLRRDGEIYAVAGISTDITERKRAAESAARLAAIVEHSDDAILSVDLDGTITSWNRGAERLYGYHPDEAIGRTVMLLVPAGRHREEPDILGRIRQGETVENYETLRRRKDGKVLDVSLTVSPIKDPSGNVIGASKLARDITDRVRAREILEQTVAERTASLREAISQMEEFSYTVSHDLRAPLRAMQGYSDALLEEHAATLNAEATRYLRRIAENSARLDKMILDVLTFSRLARADVELEPVFLNKLVRGIVENYAGMQPPHAHIQVDCPHEVMGHEPSLVQAISNLLTNSVKFVPPGQTPAIHVSSEQQDEMVTVRVRDNGIGVPPKYQSRLFNMFERVHPNLKYDGTGVGLAIVRKAVERMGGNVGMESDGVNGCCFWIQLRASGTPISR